VELLGKRIGLIGTATHDVISSDAGPIHEGPGGILYQAAVLCGLKTKTSLHTNIGEDLAPWLDQHTDKWPALDSTGVRRLSIQSNRVRLHYPEREERVEILESVVPAIESDNVLNDLPYLDMLVAVCNSGYDISLEEWRRIVDVSACPVWFDVHSLALSKEIGQPRSYVPLPGWAQWIKDVAYVQANRMELSCMTGHPGTVLSQSDFSEFADGAFKEGVEAVFVTLGRDGVLVISPGHMRRLALAGTVNALDTTGCGDVFCAATAANLVRGANLFEAARFGVELAAKAAETKGIDETFALASRFADSF